MTTVITDKRVVSVFVVSLVRVVAMVRLLCVTIVNPNNGYIDNHHHHHATTTFNGRQMIKWQDLVMVHQVIVPLR